MATTTGNIAAPNAQRIPTNAILVESRIRSDLGDINSLIQSIKENGLIQPIVLNQDYEGDKASTGQAVFSYKLVAGGRRLEALKRLGIKELIHGVHWVFREEHDETPDGRLRLQAIELEENLRRKDLDWAEIVLGKRKLLETMQKLHGVASPGGRTREERRTGESQGFGVRKLAAMLGESPATVSNDLTIAEMVTARPDLKQETSKAGAFIKALAIVAKATGRTTPVAPSQAVKPIEYRVMIFCADEKEQVALLTELQARGLKCQAVIV